MCWTRTDINAEGKSARQILLSQKVPGENSFRAAIPVSKQRSRPRFVQGCQVAVDKDGNVYVAWVEFLFENGNLPALMVSHAPPPAGGAGLEFDSSWLFPNGVPAALLPGSGMRKEVADCVEGNWLFIVENAGNFNLNLPSLATDPSSGHVYLTWSMWNRAAEDNGPRRFDVFFKSATRPAGFLNWLVGAPVVVNTNEEPPATDQFMPSITTYPLPVAPVPTGPVVIKIQWNDKRNAGAPNDKFELWSASSQRGGAWANQLVSDGRSEPMDPKDADLGCRLGEYDGTAMPRKVPRMTAHIIHATGPTAVSQCTPTRKKPRQHALGSLEKTFPPPIRYIAASCREMGKPTRSADGEFRLQLQSGPVACHLGGSDSKARAIAKALSARQLRLLPNAGFAVTLMVFA